MGNDKKVHTKFYNNGIINKRIKDGDPIPEGFVLGLKPRTPEQIRAINEKRKATNMKRYGIDNPARLAEKKEKQKKTMIERYGVAHALQNKDFINKARSTMLKRYGVKHALQNNELKEKAENTMLDRYGVKHAMDSEELRDRLKKVIVSKYGVDNVRKIKGVESKIQNTSIEKYGVPYPIQSNSVRDKAKHTLLDHYNVDSPFKSEIIQDRARNTMLDRYGVEYSMQSKDIRDKIKATLFKNYGVNYPYQSDEIKNRVKTTCIAKYGVDWPCQTDNARFSTGHSADSRPNLRFAKKLDLVNIAYDREFPLENYSYDFRITNSNILVEINPTVTHNTVCSPFRNDNLITKDYHLTKSKLANKYNYHCIHIFDWDDMDKIIDLLSSKNRKRIYARKCYVKLVPISEGSKYLNTYHLQGSCRGQDIMLGLYDNDTNSLVSLMTFGKPRYNKKYEYELLRYCSSYNVVGGAEKLFKYFVRNYNPLSIVSYCDNAKFKGNVYSKLGFVLSKTNSPSCHWYNIVNKKHYTNNFILQHGVDSILNTNYGKGTNNNMLLIENGYLPVYDCGQSTYVWNR